MTPLTALMENPLFKPLWDAFPYLPACFSRWEGMTLGDIAASTYGTADRPGRMAASAEAIDCMAALTARSLGPEAEAALRTSFSRSNAVLSANLHGIDCLPEMVQAVHFFGLDRLASGERGTVIPVLSCGGISLQSSAYPRGMLAFPEGQPIRFPLFRSAWQDTVELNAPALTERDVRAIRPLWHVSHPYIRQGLDTVVRHMLTPETLALERFGEQATGVNARLCAERFSDSRPVVVYLELEEVARALLFRDLERPDSLLHRALFVPHLRESLVRRLAGVRGCWSPKAAAGQALPRTESNGTVFFWGTDERGRRHPLRLTSSQGELRLEGTGVRLPFTPEAVVEALRDRLVYPGLFVSYMTLVFEHGLRCYGGRFLVNDLPTMIRHVCETFAERKEPLPPLPAETALAAFAVTVRARTSRGLFPAGMLEMAAAGGLDRTQLQFLANLPLEDVLPFSLAEWCLQYVPAQHRPPEWETALRDAAEHWKGITLELA